MQNDIVSTLQVYDEKVSRYFWFQKIDGSVNGILLGKRRFHHKANVVVPCWNCSVCAFLWHHGYHKLKYVGIQPSSAHKPSTSKSSADSKPGLAKASGEICCRCQEGRARPLFNKLKKYGAMDKVVLNLFMGYCKGQIYFGIYWD